jgi:SAM-dependent methyltransferase
MSVAQIAGRILQGLRWRLGFRVAAPELEAGDDSSVASFYSGRVTDCSFLSDARHFEHPRARWIIERVSGGRLLEVGCGNGGMTALLSPRVEHLVALDVSTPSLSSVAALGLENVETIESLVEHYQPSGKFDWIVMSEVLEHLRSPQALVARCVDWLAPCGSLLVTTPNGHWESNEHLQEFNFEKFAQILVNESAESVVVSYLRDGQGRRRWLVGQVIVADRPAAQEDFNDRRTIVRSRRR